jgi:hypothetical protein
MTAQDPSGAEAAITPRLLCECGDREATHFDEHGWPECDECAAGLARVEDETHKLTERFREAIALAMQAGLHYEDVNHAAREATRGVTC